MSGPSSPHCRSCCRCRSRSICADRSISIAGACSRRGGLIERRQRLEPVFTPELQLGPHHLCGLAGEVGQGVRRDLVALAQPIADLVHPLPAALDVDPNPSRLTDRLVHLPARGHRMRLLAGHLLCTGRRSIAAEACSIFKVGSCSTPWRAKLR